jgi:hypothetical protein
VNKALRSARMRLKGTPVGGTKVGQTLSKVVIASARELLLEVFAELRGEGCGDGEPKADMRGRS